MRFDAVGGDLLDAKVDDAAGDTGTPLPVTDTRAVMVDWNELALPLQSANETASVSIIGWAALRNSALIGCGFGGDLATPYNAGRIG